MGAKVTNRRRFRLTRLAEVATFRRAPTLYGKYVRHPLAGADAVDLESARCA